MKAFVVKHRHDIVGIFRDISKAANYAEKVTAEAEPDPDGLWGKGATISIQEIETDLL